MTLYEKENAKRVLVQIILAVSMLLLILPFIWMFLGAFKNLNEATAMPPVFLPSRFSFDNFIEIKKLFPIDRFLKNSLFVSLVSVALQVLFSSMAGFVFAKISFKGREFLFTCMLLTMMIPATLTLVTLYKVFVWFHLQDTYLGLILPGTYNVLGIFMMRQHIRGIADSLLEAGFMDGASHFRVFFQIILPLCKPALATITVLAFMSAWNDFLWPLIITSSTELATLPLGLTKLQGRWNTSWNLLMAGNLVSFIPMLLVYIFAQRYFIKSIALSGVKG